MNKNYQTMTLKDFFNELLEGAYITREITERQGGSFFAEINYETHLNEVTLMAKPLKYAIMEAQRLCLAIEELEEFSIRDIYLEYRLNIEYIAGKLEEDSFEFEELTILHKCVCKIFDKFITRLNELKIQGFESMDISITEH